MAVHIQTEERKNPGEAAATDPDLVNIACARQNEDGDEEVANDERK
jgi:hypothetical protein